MRASPFRLPVRRLTVLYDADCDFCSWTARQLRRLDRERRLELLPLQHASRHLDRPAVAALERRRLQRELHVVGEGGDVARGGRAILEIVDVLPGGRLLRPWRALPGAAALADVAYRVAARNRGVLGRLVGARRRVGAVCDLE